MSVSPAYGPQRPRRIQIVATVLSVLLVTMLLAQLYTYEDFATGLLAVLPSNDQTQAKIIAAVVVVLELLAIPYLLSMFLSPLMRFVSACSAVVVTLLWLLLALTNAHATNVPLFNDVLVVPGGLIPFAWTVTMLVCISTVVQSDTTAK